MIDKKPVIVEETLTNDPLGVLTRIRSFSEIRNGIYTTMERLLFRKKNVLYKHSDESAEQAFLKRNPSAKKFKDDQDATFLERSDYLPWKIIESAGDNIEKDLEIWKSQNKGQYTSALPTGCHIRGKKKNLFIHKKADVYPGVVFDTSEGVVVIDSDAVIKPFSFIEGPVYTGRDCRIDNAKIGGGTIIGHSCRIGGEVENSVIGDFSNKHHEGFLGHSVIGSWVNIGALATTSDLKNNYGLVKLNVSEFSYTTNTIKFGSVIGDYTKIAIGVMLNTGTVVDFGSSVVLPRVSGYIPPFSWIDGSKKYRLDKFLEDSRKIMSRRNRTMLTEEEKVIRAFYSNHLQAENS